MPRPLCRTHGCGSARANWCKRLTARSAEAASGNTVAAPYGGSGDTSIVTAVPSGGVVAEGSPVVWINDRPLMVLRGAVPLYRDVGVGDTGTVVRELQEALGRVIGPISDPPGTFGPDTADKVGALYVAAGTAAPSRAAADGSPQTYVPRSEVAIVGGTSPWSIVKRPAVGATVDPKAVVTLDSGTPVLTAQFDTSDRPGIDGSSLGGGPDAVWKAVAKGNPVQVRGGSGATATVNPSRVSAAEAADGSPDAGGPNAVIEVRAPIPAAFVGDSIDAWVDVTRTGPHALIAPAVCITTNANGDAMMRVPSSGGDTPRTVPVDVGLVTPDEIEIRMVERPQPTQCVPQIRGS